MNDQIQNKLLDFITRAFMVDREEIVTDESLVDQGIIDSFGLVEIAAFMEQAFGLPVSEEEMIRENFGSVLRIVAFVERKLEK